VGLDSGRAWSRVRRITSSDGGYEISTPVATAAVRGTAFDVDCRTATVACTFTVVDGTVAVIPKGGSEIILRAGQSLIVRVDGTVERAPDRTADDLRQDPWLAQNL